MGERGVALPGRGGTATSAIARAGAARAYAGDATLRDLQALLGQAVQRLCERTGCVAAYAWALNEDATPYLAAASFSGTPPRAPETAAFRAVAALAAATDLSEGEAEGELREIALRYECDAIAPVRGSSGPPLAALLLRVADAAGAAEDARVRRVPPRILAELEAAARRLGTPLSAALAQGRLLHLDGEVRELDRRAQLGSLAAEIAHEVRNPLVSLKALLQLLPERCGEPEFVREFCEVVEDEMVRTERLLDLLLEQGGPSRLGETPAPVAPALAATEALLRHPAQRRGVTLAFEAEPDLPRVPLESDRLRQVLLNLALNAVEATPRGGSVRMDARRRENRVELVVSDDGPGIPLELRDLIFEPFVSTRRERPAGLGLAIARRLVEEAGGALQLDEGEAGTAMRVLLPVPPP